MTKVSGADPALVAGATEPVARLGSSSIDPGEGDPLSDGVCARRDASIKKVWREPDAVEALVSALQRLDRNFNLLLAGKPVRDVAETRAEVAAALAKAVSK